MKLLPISFLLLGFWLWGCKHPSDRNRKKVKSQTLSVSANRTVKVLPLGIVADEFIKGTFKQIKAVLPNAELLTKEQIPQQCFYSPRSRYRADKIISWLASRAKKQEVIIGITMQDISTTKGATADYGVMGLGYQPGKSCVASSYRVKRKMKFYKVALHELGHTAGLPHCFISTCFMVDAKGGDPTGRETGFCHECSQKLRELGWKL